MKYRIEEIHRKNGDIQFCPQYKRWLFWHYFYDKNDDYFMVKTREEAERFLALLVGKRKEEAEQRKKYLENLERKLEGEAVVGRKVHEWHS